MRDGERPLVGGRVTPGVVRVGHTVRRPPGTNAEFIHTLLGHLAAVGFEGAPRFLGTDEQGRDILSYIEGDVPTDLGWHDDDTLVAAARLIRSYHEATIGLVPSQPTTPALFEVVCHNDLSPCNFVFVEGRPVALIDFDTAALGTRRMDVSYAAWGWLDLGNAEIAATEQRRRLRLFLRTYGQNLDERSIKQVILDRQDTLATQGERDGKTAMAQWARHCRRWTLENL